MSAGAKQVAVLGDGDEVRRVGETRPHIFYIFGIDEI